MDAKGIVGILLAAGRGSRFDATGERNKLMQHMPDGRTVAASAATALRDVLETVVAVVPEGADKLSEELSAAGCMICECATRQQGLSESIRHGIQALAGAGGWIIALADMPCVQAATVVQLADALRKGAGIAAPVHQNIRGNPVGFSAMYRSELLSLNGDAGARFLLHTRPVVLVEVDDPGIFQDIDIENDLAMLRAKQTLCNKG